MPARTKDGHVAGDLENQIHDNVNEHDETSDMLANAIQDVGSLAFGTVAVEVWTLNEHRTHLVQAPSGFWVDPIFLYSENASDSLAKLTDGSRSDHVPAEPLAPGCGLAGALWAESSSTGKQFKTVTDSREKAQQLWRNMGSSSRSDALEGRTTEQPVTTTLNFSQSVRGSIASGGFLKLPSSPYRGVVWREVGALAIDPDQPYNPRLNLLAQAGFGLAAGVPFKVRDHEGIVVYLARESADRRKLKSCENETYLTSATEFIGAVWALQEPRRAVLRSRHKERANLKQRIRNKIIAIHRMGVSLEDYVKQEDEEPKPHGKFHAFMSSFHEGKDTGENNEFAYFVKRALREMRNRAKSTVRKLIGGGLAPPPAMPLQQSLWTFIGAFTTLVTLTKFATFLARESDGDMSIIMAPFGALMTLQYGLTAAPASQPRNAIMGQAVSLTVALALTYIEFGDSTWVRPSLAAAISIALMTKLGVTHPPAGAAAVVFASGRLGWEDMGGMLIANIIAIGFAAIINNMNSKRQYPTFWGLERLVLLLQCGKGGEGGE